MRWTWNTVWLYKISRYLGVLLAITTVLPTEIRPPWRRAAPPRASDFSCQHCNNVLVLSRFTLNIGSPSEFKISTPIEGFSTEKSRAFPKKGISSIPGTLKVHEIIFLFCLCLPQYLTEHSKRTGITSQERCWVRIESRLSMPVIFRLLITWNTPLFPCI